MLWRRPRTRENYRKFSEIVLGDIQLKNFQTYTMKPRFTGPVRGKELGPVNREARYIGVHFTLI